MQKSKCGRKVSEREKKESEKKTSSLAGLIPSYIPLLSTLSKKNIDIERKDGGKSHKSHIKFLIYFWIKAGGVKAE